MTKQIKKVVIVGGGSAGWLTAGTIAAHHTKQDGEGLQVTLIESPNIPTIGVGEGTWPTMRGTLQKMGVSETDFFRECDASFKQGAKFAKWVTGAEDDFYYHPLVLPEGYANCNLVPHWLSDSRGQSFSAATCVQEHLCEKNLAPKSITTPEYAAVANYAYHLNAGKFSEFLKRHCTTKLGVEFISDDVTTVNSAENGDIASVSTKNSGDLEGDLFVDCTGFRSLLLGQHYDVPFKECKSTLFIDAAMAVQVPYESEDSEVTPYTVSTGQEAGWIWDIGLVQRRGIGHVFSTAHTTDERAEEVLRTYLRDITPDADKLDVRRIPINPGHRTQFWKNNCVGVGLSAGFLEPLEASALVLIELSSKMIAEQFPATRDAMDIVSKRFNAKFTYRWERIIDFLKLHYILTKRNDHAFWVDNCDPATIPDSLKELMTLWKYQSPWLDDFDHKDEVFPSASYQFVLYGMGFETDATHVSRMAKNNQMADKYFNMVQDKADKFSAAMPSTRELLTKIHKFGMQPV